ncbi:hypothetical protein QNH25_12150 [Bacillus safensis]|uniref:hypothetical protein n=1 Tax=Bacillus safensis TaxID=561879 RepID=UPI000F0489CC|nr:hypothetical protein [Bacillus safensis]MBS4742278.1 hypothetical protein [Bacillus safensis]MED4592092.1 hypothetical protein [Bacillus safensis]MED4637599.1 hypothetical protein [Bacillus safensis]WBL28839.1 hypothetical protein ORQ91_01412 [Bacillus safensis]WHX74086.1 hypothetical protein QNH25_12150 [Bacillus safensis]
MDLLLRPKQFFNQNQSIKTIVGLVLLSLFVSTVFLTFFIIDLLVDEPLSTGKQLASIIFIFLLTIPLYFILNFLSTVLTSIYMYFFHKAFILRKMYLVILVYNAFLLLVNSAAIYCVMVLQLDHYFLLIQIVSFLFNLYLLRILYDGIIYYAEGSKKAALATVILYMLVTTAFVIGGFING